jgi:hypothetical protein
MAKIYQLLNLWTLPRTLVEVLVHGAIVLRFLSQLRPRIHPLVTKAKRSKKGSQTLIFPELRITV